MKYFIVVFMTIILFIIPLTEALALNLSNPWRRWNELIEKFIDLSKNLLKNVSFNGVVVDYSINHKTIEVALTEPWKISVSKTLNIGEIVKVDVKEAKVIRARDGKEEKLNLPSLLTLSVTIKGNYHKTSNIFYGKQIIILQEPSGYNLGKGIIKTIGENCFSIEIKGTGGDIILRNIRTLSNTVFLKEGSGRAKFTDLTPGMIAEAKGYLWKGVYYATLVSFSPKK